jgi:hypothetical protein
MKNLIFFLASFLFFSCTNFKVIERNTKYRGYFCLCESRAKVISSNTKIPIDSLRALLVVPKSEYTREMAKKLNFFDEIITTEELNKRISEKTQISNQTDLNSEDGLKNASLIYKPFLFLSLEQVIKNKKPFQQIKLYNPQTNEYLWLAEVQTNSISDKSTWYPLFNSLVDYFKLSSKIFK